MITADLAGVRDLGHEHGGTVNDVILAAVTGALRALLASRGEQLEQVTVSVPVSARQHATSGQLGNQVGVMPVALPTTGNLAGRITQTAAITGQRKTAAKGTSVALIGPLFRLLAATGLLRWFINRQRLVHTFTTNLRGPAQPLTLAGAPLRAIIPIANTAGNVPVTFAALSYARRPTAPPRRHPAAARPTCRRQRGPGPQYRLPAQACRSRRPAVGTSAQATTRHRPVTGQAPAERKITAASRAAEPGSGPTSPTPASET